MRLYCVVLVLAVALLTGTNASEHSTNVIISSPNTRGLNNAPISADNEVSIKRVLRKGELADDNDEERGFKDVVDKVLKKAKKLAKYNKWIFADKSPDWVKLNYPKYAKGYDKFWENRMVRGGKYN